MKSYNEIADNILKRRDEYDRKKAIKRKKIMGTLAAAAVFAAVLLSGYIWQSTVKEDNNIVVQGTTGQESYEVLTQDITSDTEKSIEATTAQGDKDISSNDCPSGNDGYSTGEAWFRVPLIPIGSDVELTGEKITDEEAAEYFRENLTWLSSALTQSGVPGKNFRISEKGYCHISYDGTEGKGFEIKQDYRDYLAYNGDDLVAIITLVKEEGELYATPSFGGTWFSDYNNFLKAHKGQELIYVYANIAEIVIAPDGSIYNAYGFEEKYLEGHMDNAYELFYHPEAVYVP